MPKSLLGSHFHCQAVLTFSGRRLLKLDLGTEGEDETTVVGHVFRDCTPLAVLGDGPEEPGDDFHFDVRVDDFASSGDSVFKTDVEAKL